LAYALAKRRPARIERKLIMYFTYLLLLLDVEGSVSLLDDYSIP